MVLFSDNLSQIFGFTIFKKNINGGLQNQSSFEDPDIFPTTE